MRMLRIKIRGRVAVYHCISRIVGGQKLLDDVCKEEFRKRMWRQADFCGMQMITYCILSNHFHILVRAPETPVVPDSVLHDRVGAYYGKKSQLYKTMGKELRTKGRLSQQRRESLFRRMGDVSIFMKELKQKFSVWYNRRNDRFGTLWAERFTSLLVEDQPETVGTVAAYIDLNPVRARLVDDPKDYRFSGYTQALAGGDQAEPARQGILSFSSSSDWKQAAAQYRTLMLTKAARASHSKKTALSPETIRKKLEHGAKVSKPELLRLRVRYFNDGVALGSEAYVQSIFLEFRDRFSAKRKTGPRPIRGLPLPNLRTLRDLRLERFS